MVRKALLTTLVLVSLAALAAPAVAETLGTVSLRYVQPGATGTSSVTYDPSDGPRMGTGTVHTGAYMFEIDPSAPRTGLGLDLPVGEMFGAVCIDVTQCASSSYRDYSIVPLTDAPLTPYTGVEPMSANRAALIENLWHDHFDLDWIAPGPYSLTEKLMAEAFNAAVWELVFEEEGNPLNILDGALQVADVNDTSLANDWLAGLDAGGERTTLYALSNSCYRDYVVLIPTRDDDRVVPEPITMTGLLIGVGSLATYVRKRRRSR